MIEDGAPWPSSTNEGRLAFMSKDIKTLDDVLAYRLLSILSALYRRWATVRLRNLKQWIATWAHVGPPTLEQTRQVLNGEIIRLNDRLHLTPLNGDKEYDVGYPGDAIDRERARNEKKMKERRV